MPVSWVLAGVLEGRGKEMDVLVGSTAGVFVKSGIIDEVWIAVFISGVTDLTNCGV